MQYNVVGYNGIAWNSMQYNAMGYNAIAWNIIGHHGTPWNHMESDGIMQERPGLDWTWTGGRTLSKQFSVELVCRFCANLVREGLMTLMCTNSTPWNIME